MHLLISECVQKDCCGGPQPQLQALRMIKTNACAAELSAKCQENLAAFYVKH